MAITVGLDTYITVVEADDIVNQCYNDQPISQKWAALSTAAKESYLRTATYRVDCLPLNSYKHNINQPLQFPRGMSGDVPLKVKLATVEEALGANDDELLHRITLQQQGVTAVKLGNASESYDTANKQNTGTLLSPTAYNYMRQYLLGSAVIA